MDSRVQQAREAHRKATSLSGLARRYRQQRDDLIRLVYSEGEYSYSSLARQIGCSPELVAKALHGRQN